MAVSYLRRRSSNTKKTTCERLASIMMRLLWTGAARQFCVNPRRAGLTSKRAAEHSEREN
jgi:hypothetical protein